MFYHVLIATFALLTVRAFVTKLSAWQYQRVHGLAAARQIPQGEKILGIGQLRRMLKNTAAGISLQSHFEATKENGPTTSVVILGQKFISTSDPENIKAVLATKFKDFDLGERNDAFGPFLGSGIFAADGAHWEKSRALIRPSFTKAQVAELPTVEEHFQNLVSRIPADAATVDLQPLFFNFTLDSATHFLFGHSVGFQLSPAGSEAEKFSRAFDRAQEHLQTRALVGRFRALLKNRQFMEDCHFVHTFVDGYVTEMQQHRLPGHSIDKQHEQSGNSLRYNLMGELANATNDPVQLRNELLNVLLAARDTTASLLSSTFFLLARHPSAWNRLQSEIAQLNGQPPSYEDIRDMRYVRAVLHETLRLYPPVPTNIRYAKTHTSLPHGGGQDGSLPILVAKGTIVHYSAWTMHRSSDIYGADAEHFRPERWLGDDGDRPLRPGWGFLAFSGGPRICIGQQKALTEAAYVVIRMLQTYAGIEARDERAWREHMGLVLSSYHGVKVGLALR